MPISLLMLVVIAVGSGLFLVSKNTFFKNENVWGEKNIEETIPTESLNPIPTQTPTTTNPKPSSAPASITPSPTDQSTSQNSNLSDFIYPNSKQVLSSGNGLTLESSDKTDSITNWYKEKIRQAGMNAKSFVTTKTNDKVLNKLVGGDGTREINVEISKEPGSTVVKITIKVT